MRNSFRLLVPLAILVAMSVVARAQGRIGLEQVLGAPFPSGLVAAPSGGAVAWVQNDRGTRNILVAGAPAYEGRQVTSYETDNGQEISNLQFTIDGTAIVFVRGGAPNRQGEIPNAGNGADGRNALTGCTVSCCTETGWRRTGPRQTSSIESSSDRTNVSVEVKNELAYPLSPRPSI